MARSLGRFSWLIMLSIIGWSAADLNGQNCPDNQGAAINETFDLRQNTECIISFKVLNGLAADNGTTYTMFSGATEARAQLVLCAIVGNASRRQRVVFDLSTLELQGWRRTDSDKSLVILGDNDNTTRIIDLVLKEDGPTSISIDFGRGREDDINPDTWRRRTTFSTPVMTVVGILTEEDIFWNNNNSNFEGLVAYDQHPEYEKYLTEALVKMDEILRDDYQRLVAQDPTIASTNEFVKKYESFIEYSFIKELWDIAKQKYDELLGAQVQEPAEPPEPTAAELDNAEWNRVYNSRDTNLINAYLLNHHHPPSRSASHFQAAQDSLLSWRPPYYKILGESNGWTEYQLFNFSEPAYRDIYAHRLDIDDDRLAEDGIIRLHPRRQGELSMEILDRQFNHKSLRIELDNPMQARLDFDSISGLFTVFFERGTKPFRLVLIDAESRLLVWGKDNIQTDRVSFSQEELREAGVEGELVTQAYGLGAVRPMEVRNGAIILAALPESNWVMYAIIAFGFLLLAVLIILLIRNRKRRPPTIFDQA